MTMAQTQDSGEEKAEESSRPLSLDIDEMLSLVGEYGRFQKMIIGILIITTIPCYFPLFVTYFSTISPSWKCSLNSTKCLFTNKTFTNTNNDRCDMSRKDWHYATPRDYSIVTEFDLVCDKEYLVELTTSVLFFGFMFGAMVLGYCADNFGRKKVYFISLAAVLLLSFLNIFTGNIYLFITCRFVIGFFLHGTFPQAFLIASEIIGNQHRAFTMAIMVLVGPWVAFPFLSLQAYFISSWKVLFLVCTVPYFVLLLSMKFVPESVRYSRVKGEINEAMLVFKRVAYWNKTQMPSNVTIEPVFSGSTADRLKSGPLDLFKTARMASMSLIVGFSSFAISMTMYCLLLEAGNMTGHMYRDFAVINLVSMPTAFVTPALLNHFGRKRTIMAFGLMGGISCIALGFTPNNEELKVLRLVLGISGVMAMYGGGVAYRTWALELFPTHIRGVGMGFSQFTNKIGATSSPWIVTEMSKIYPGAAFIMIGSFNVISLCLQTMLRETKGVKTADTEKELDDVCDLSEKTANKMHGEDTYELEVTSYTNYTYGDVNGASKVDNVE